MAKGVSIGHSFIFLIVLISVGGLLMKGVSSQTCTDGLGTCTAKEACDAACKSKRGQDAGGLCDTSSGVSLCQCIYKCPGPPQTIKPKTCNDGLGVCSNACAGACCAQKCAQKHPGGKGFCDNSVSALRLCQCQYQC